MPANAAPQHTIGAHVDSTDPLSAAARVGAGAIQFFLADPQGWKAPRPHEHADAIKASDLTVYVHAPYVLNVATTNNRIRIPSRKLLNQHAAAAAAIGAKGLIVHGGHVTAEDDPAIGVDNWRKVFSRAAESGGFPLPILIENTAGGTKAMARRLDRIAQLWDAIGEYEPGFCLDTCHAHAGGEDLTGIVDRIKAITGRIDLVHANDSRDAFDSGADRHANFGTGLIEPDAIAAVVRAAASDVVVETPGDGQAEDISYLRANTG
ncbi:deoxyribonuclease IV [Jatrophihabitans lederbergiae]|uniref:Deoxyribonuclease IV n=1 Tax=Jatrophihabitans lederbergiae TaxID=3075547 RepID=A0ABU2JBB7_9ACTN|nr:deoxyribonuclease IV [Jatrophihabitans sp. DSM 44399]MDT0262271.1 deoxyribonuclease IV [Jatrophihabitans sp. DSM 44399]